MKLKPIFQSEKYYSICECDRVTGLVIDVTRGGIAAYSRIVELTDDEMVEFRAKGHLDDLAYRITRGDEEALQRELLPEAGERLEYEAT